MTRGFCTIATGNEYYFKMAKNLLLSYLLHAKVRFPFAIIADKENAYTCLFDKVIILKNSTSTYLDKIELLNNIPFDQTIFIDADSLCYGDIDFLFDDKRIIFSGVKQLGNIYPISRQIGWFKKEDIGSFANKAHFSISSHGGIMFIANDHLKDDIYKTSVEIATNYHLYNFSLFDKPADEPIIALSMSIHNCPPVPFIPDIFAFLPTTKHLKTNLRKAELSYTDKYTNIRYYNTRILHFSTAKTKEPIYLSDTYRLYHSSSYICFIIEKYYELMFYAKTIKHKICIFLYNAMK